MAQPILKRRLNPLLLISTVAALSLLAGVAVLSQDQMADVQQERSSIEKELQEAESEAERLRAEIGNKTAKIRQMNGNISHLEKQLDKTKSELENKTERVEELESKLEEQSQALNRSDTLSDLNQSLQNVCYIETQEGNRLSESSLSICRDWSHKVNNSEG